MIIIIIWLSLPHGRESYLVRNAGSEVLTCRNRVRTLLVWMTSAVLHDHYTRPLPTILFTFTPIISSLVLTQRVAETRQTETIFSARKQQAAAASTDTDDTPSG